MDWEKWMAEHHIKLRGDIPHDDRPDEKQAGNVISGSKVETEMSNDAGQTSRSHIQKPKRT